jgi:iron complex outermembrane receptor protein
VVAINSILLSGLFVAPVSFGQQGPVTTIEEVVVLGRGETRQVQVISAAQIDRLPAGTSPLKAIEKMPGVNFQSADPYGAYEWSARISIRGFDRTRLGFTLDGVPLGDMTYGNHNGLHISRAIAGELVDRVELSQGTGSLDTASTSNLGGVVKFFSAEPTEEFGIGVNQMLGSDSAQNTYLVLNTGEFGGGTRGYLAISDSNTEKWKGGGDQEHRKYTLKAVQAVGEGNVTFFYNDSDRAEIDYQDLSKDIVRRRGWDWDNWYPNWNAAVAAADTCQASGGNDGVACDDAYWNASGLRQDVMWYLGGDMPITDTINASLKYYAHENDGQGLWGTPYVSAPGGAPLSIRTTEYDIERDGWVGDLSWSLANHNISVGFWIENNDFSQARRFYAEPSRTAPTRDFKNMQSNPFRTDWEYDFTTETTMLYIQDAWQISDVIRMDFGVRAIESENKALTLVGPVKTGTIKADDSFLPQIGINYTISDSLEWFASAAENIRTFASSGTSGPFSTTSAGFNAVKDTLQPETSVNLETGLRFRGASYDGLIAAYSVKFDDRLLGITTGPGILGNLPILANVGSVTTRGLEGAINWQLSDQLNWFTSMAWTDSEYSDNYTTGTRVVAVEGKQVTDTPELLLKSELSYEMGNFFARVDLNYTDERYYTYLNDGGVDDYTLFNGTVGYNFGEIGMLKDLTLQLDATNIGDEEFYSTIDSAGFGESDINGTRQTLLRGAPQQWFISAKARF